MKKLIGIYLNNKSNKKLIINQLYKNNLSASIPFIEKANTALFSAITIDKMIDEEYKHDKIIVCTSENSTLSSMSSGQQKKALLAYQISQKPENFILDDVYSNVDKEAQKFIDNEMVGISQNHNIIQIFFRKRDLLPCIDYIITIDENNTLLKEQSKNEFLSEQSEISDKKPRFQIPENLYSSKETSDPLIKLHQINVSYEDKKVLTDVSWEINKGEFWQLVGPNGSGKSTLVGMISGDNPKAYGQDMILFGRKKGSGETIWDIKQQIGYFTPNMISMFTRNDSVENMIISGLNDSVGLYIEPTDLQKDIAHAWTKMLGPEFENKNFQQLSIGQQRMVMVVRAMVKHPPLLILDEPTIELDDINSTLFIQMVQSIAADKQVAIIYVSHRDEDDLQPDKIFELVKTTKGYTGIIK